MARGDNTRNARLVKVLALALALLMGAVAIPTTLVWPEGEAAKLAAGAQDRDTTATGDIVTEEVPTTEEATPPADPVPVAPPTDPVPVFGDHEEVEKLLADSPDVPATLPPAEHTFSYRNLPTEEPDSLRGFARDGGVDALITKRATAPGNAGASEWGMPSWASTTSGPAFHPATPLFVPSDFVDGNALRNADPDLEQGDEYDRPIWEGWMHGPKPKSVDPSPDWKPTPFKGKPYERLVYKLCPPAAPGDFKLFMWDVYDPVIQDLGQYDPALQQFVFTPDGESDTLYYYGDPQFPGADNPDGLVFYYKWRDRNCNGLPDDYDVSWPFAEFWGDRGNGKVTFTFEFPFEDAFEDRDEDLVRDSSAFQQHIGFWEDGEPLFYAPGDAPDTDNRPEAVNVQNAFEEVYDDRNTDGVLDPVQDRYHLYWDVQVLLDGAIGENNGIVEAALYDIETAEFRNDALLEDWRVLLFLDQDDDGKGPLTNVMASQNQVDEHYWLDNVGPQYFHAPPEAFTDAFDRAPRFGKLPFTLSDKMNGVGPKDKDFSGVPPPPVSPIPSPPVPLTVGGGGCGGGGTDRGYPAKYAEGIYQGLYLLLTEILDAGLTVPPQIVPYWIYTLSDGGVEKFCQALTNVPATINVDDDATTGKGMLGDIRVNSHLELGPLTFVSRVDLLGDVNPAFLRLNLSLPAFFFNGEAHDADGEPWWKMGYVTQPGHAIPRDITLSLAVDRTVGAEHVFDFDWTSQSGIEPLGFQFGIFQVVAEDLSNPVLPATSDFTVSSPPFAFLTFSTFNTATTTTNCMNWSAPSAFTLNFAFTGNRTLLGTPVNYTVNVLVQQIPQAWSLCLTQDRAANTDTLTYTASANVNLLILNLGLNITGITNVTIYLQVEDITTGWSATLGDGFLDFTVLPAGQKIGALILNVTETSGFLNILNAFAGLTIVFYSITLEGVPSFTATWDTAAGTPPWTRFGLVTAMGLSLDAVSAAISTVPGAFLFFGSAETQKAQLYHNNSIDLGTGTAQYEASLWVHFEDLTRVEVGWGGASPTVAVGFSTVVPHSLRVIGQLGNASVLNPIDPPGPIPDTNLSASIITTDLPASMDFNVTPATNFSYAASGEITLITATLRTDEASATIEIEGIPDASEGRWLIDETGYVRIGLADRLDRIEAVFERPDRLFDTDFRHVEALILDIPEGVNATWDLPNRTGRLSFLDGGYDEGLGEIAFLGTTGLEVNTTNYLNSLGVGSACMLDYADYTGAIDADYWPANVPPRLDALHCRHPTLDTVLDDYYVDRSGANATDDFEMQAFRAREIGVLDLNLTAAEGHADLEFSRNIVLDRSFYYLADDFDGDEITLVEVSNLPDGQPTNSVHVGWDFNLNPGDRNHAEYDLSEVIPFIDYYNGVHAFTNFSAAMMKIVLQDIPASVDLDWLFGDRTGSLDFVASSLWEIGILSQDGGTRYVGWVALQSMHFDYDFALPGEESCDFPGSFNIVEYCYRVFRLDTTLDAVSADLDGVFGIYKLETGLENLDSGEVPDGDEYVPEWAFMMDDFDVLEVHILWDIGFAINGLLFLAGGVPIVDFSLLPSVNIVLNVGAVVADFFWNDKVDEELMKDIPLPFFFLLNPCPITLWTVTVEVNTVKDYVDQNPVHLFPSTGASLLDDSSTFSYSPPNPVIPCAPPEMIGANIVLDVPGFHRFPDHPSLFP